MQRLKSISTLLLAVTGLTALVLVATFGLSAKGAMDREAAAKRAEAVVDVSRDLFAAQQTLRIERDTVSTAMASATPADAETLRDIDVARGQSQQALDSALSKLASTRPDGATAGVADIGDASARFQSVRRQADAAIRAPQGLRPAELSEEWVATDDALSGAIERESKRLSNRIDNADPVVGQMMTIKQLAWAARSAAGTDRLLLGAAIARDKGLTGEQTIQLSTVAGRVDALWAIIYDDVRGPATPSALRTSVAVAEKRYFGDLRDQREAVIEALAANRPSPVSSQAWPRKSDPGLASLIDVANTAFAITHDHVAALSAQADRDATSAILAVVLVMMLSGVTALFIITRVVTPLARMTETMHRVAQGDLEHPIPYVLRHDEIGRLANALAIFRHSALERRRVESELLNSQVEAEVARAANQMKSSFLASISHEIRTPLNGVLGMVQAMAIDTLSPVQRVRLEIVRESGETLLAILNDLLDLSKIEAGKLELEEVDFDMVGLAEGAHAAFTAVAQQKGLLFDLKIQKGARSLYRGDATRIRQIIYNLVSNALKFTETGQVQILITNRKQVLSIAVSDTGIGMSADQLDGLFQKFQQAEASISRRYGGTGLGLAICRELATVMGGSITASSELGQGTTITVALPLPKVARPAKAPAPATNTPPEGETEVRPMKVLVAEDNAINQLVLKTLLHQAGIEPFLVENGALAVAAWEREPWDLILMDVQMPEMDGPTAARIIREQELALGRARKPIVALTANVMAHQVAEYYAAGMDGFIAKPIEIAALFAALQDAASSDLEESSAAA